MRISDWSSDVCSSDLVVASAPCLVLQGAYVEVVLQVGADAGAVGHDRDAVSTQLRFRADAGQHQQLRRVDRTAAEDHFPRGPVADCLAPAGTGDRKSTRLNSSH